MEDMELICLQIISNAGEARSESMAALPAARNSRVDLIWRLPGRR